MSTGRGRGGGGGELCVRDAASRTPQIEMYGLDALGVVFRESGMTLWIAYYVKCFTEAIRIIGT